VGSASPAAAPGTGLADRWAHERLPVVRGPARSLQAMPGGKATHAPPDAHQIAACRRGGRRPHAAVYPAARRATRDLLRRRRPRRRKRAERRTPVQTTHAQEHRPASSQTIASKAHRTGRAEGVPAPAVPQRSALALGLRADADGLRTERARERGQTANARDGHPG
jgi:hypothetical protein